MSSESSKNIIKILASVSGIVLLAKVIGFVKQMVTADAFGATIETDLITLSSGMISNLDYLLVQVLSTAFLPIYIKIKTDSKEQGDRFVSNSIKILLIVTALISTVLFFGSPILARVLAPSYDETLSSLLSVYIKIFAPAIIVIVEMAVFNALLKANEKFVPGEFIGFNQSIIVIVFVLLGGALYGPNILVFAIYVSALFSLVFLMICSRKLWCFRKDNPFKDPNIRRLVIMMGPLLLGYSMVFVNQQVDKIIVSGLGEGTLTAMNYASTLSNFVCTFTGSICGVMFTYITQSVAQSKVENAAKIGIKTAIQMITFLLPVTIIAVMNSEDIVRIVFGRGKFDEMAIRNCSLALIGYCFMFVPYILRELFARFQYAYGDSKQPMINSCIAICINIALSVFLSRWLGVLGVTIATSVSVTISAVLNIYFSKKKNEYLNSEAIIKNLPLWLLGGIVCVVLTFILQYVLSNTYTIVRVFVITITSLLAYSIINRTIVTQVLKGFRKNQINE